MKQDFPMATRRGLRGKPFKLFSDELPRIEFNKGLLDDYKADSKDDRRAGDRSIKRRSTINHDRFSLPSIGTPEWDMLSNSDRPKSESPDRFLQPNMIKVNRRIRRKYGIDDHKNYLFPSGKNKEEQQKKVNSVSASERVSLNDSKNAGSVENSGVVVVDASNIAPEPETSEDKPKSLLQKLLDESAQETAKIKSIEESLKLGHRVPTIRRRKPVEKVRKKIVESVKIIEEKEVEEDEPVVNENLSDEVVVSTKPGILKRTVSLRENNHSLSPGIYRSNWKPRLKHWDEFDIQVNTDRNATVTRVSNISDDVKVSVYVNSPVSRLNDLFFETATVSGKKSKSKRRVNFDDSVKEKDTECNGHRSSPNGDTVNGILPEESSDTDIPFNIETENKQLENKECVKDFANQKEKVTPDANHFFESEIKIESKAPETKLRRKKSKKSKDLFRDTYDHQKINKVSDDNDNDIDLIDTILLNASKKESRGKPIWKEARTPLPGQVSDQRPDTVDIVSAANSPAFDAPPQNDISTSLPSSSQPTSGLHGKHGSHVPTLHIPIDRFESSTIESFMATPDIGELSDFNAFYDEFDFSEFPDEIDRSLVGEELIKAYRLWDRKRKAFPGGLRKIEPPIEREDFFYLKRYGNVRTYKMASFRSEIKTVPDIKPNSKPDLDPFITYL